MKKLIFSLCVIPLLAGMAILSAAKSGSLSDRIFENTQRGDLEFASIGRLNFGPEGLLLVSDPASASVVAMDTGDTGPLEKLEKPIQDVDAMLAARLGAPVDGIEIVDLAVNPASGKIYLSLVRKADNLPVLARIDAGGSLEEVPLAAMPYVRLTLPTGENARLRSVTDLAFVDDQVVVAGQSSEEFSNKIYAFPAPLEHGEAGKFYSAETYHVSHRKWETKAPIQSFIPYEEDGEFYIVGAFACTPIAKFPLGDIESGAKVKGISVVELGSGNRPRDMFTYEKNGEHWLVTNTKRFGKTTFGPSAYWGARVDMEYLRARAPEETNENAARRNVQAPQGPEAKGIEVVDQLSGAVLVSQLENDEVVVLREVGDKHVLEIARMP